MNFSNPNQDKKKLDIFLFILFILNIKYYILLDILLTKRGTGYLFYNGRYTNIKINKVRTLKTFDTYEMWSEEY